MKNIFRKILIIQVAIFFISFIAYIAQVNILATKSYDISLCQKDIKQITQDNKDLEGMVFLQATGYDMDTVALNLDFEKIENIEYIKTNVAKLGQRK